MVKGAIADTFSNPSRLDPKRLQSCKFPPIFTTSISEATLNILVCNSDLKPFITERTTINAITPRVIPIMLVKDIKDIKFLLFKRVYLEAIQNS